MSRVWPSASWALRFHRRSQLSADLCRLPFGKVLSLCLLMVVAGCDTHPSAPGAILSATQSAAGDTNVTAPLLAVSVGQARVGTQVSLTVANCLPRRGKPDQITWRDAAVSGAAPATRELSDIRRQGDELQASFTVLPGDAVGQGILDAVCGSPATHALASFTVLPP
jgi:hypothetical protein